jgi:hypothetical protein
MNVVPAEVPYAFYLPEDPDNTIVQSALETVRFLFHVSDRDDAGHLRCRSIDAGPDGELVRYRGRLMDGVGYCADSIFGSHVLVRLGRVLERPELEEAGFSYLDHALTAGFFDDADLPVRLYRDTETGRFLDNLEDHGAYLEPGHIARVGTQLLRIASLDPDDERAERCRRIAARTAGWIRSIDRCENGWYPRRCTRGGEPFPFAANAFGPTDLVELTRRDPIHDRSGSGVLAIELLASATEAGILDASIDLRRDVDAFVEAGGHFGSTNTDTEDLHENVSYALAFQALRHTSEVLDDPALRDFAYERCLAPLARFELTRDLNQVATKGLLYMETSWNAACTWEMAEAAQAYLIAFADRSQTQDALKALTIMRGMAMHHHGDHGFLTEAVDWDGHSTSLRHFPGERYGDIITTHPFLNNLHVVQPTVTFLERFAVRGVQDDVPGLYDLEGNQLCDLPVALQDWMRP